MTNNGGASQMMETGLDLTRTGDPSEGLNARIREHVKRIVQSQGCERCTELDLDAIAAEIRQVEDEQLWGAAASAAAVVGDFEGSLPPNDGAPDADEARTALARKVEIAVYEGFGWTSD